MSDVNTKDLHPEIWKLFDRYVHGLIDRRGFLDGAAKYTAGSMTAVGILEALRPNYAEAQIERCWRVQRPQPAAFRLSLSSTRTAASTRTSRMSSDAPRSPDSWRSGPTR